MEDEKQIISNHMSRLAKKRKNPYLPFKDKDYASKMGKKRAKKNVAEKPSETEKTTEE